jgi:hypothetical protein
MILALSIHYSRASDLVRPDHLLTSPAVAVTAYRDLFGNWCSRIVAPAGTHAASPPTRLIHDQGLLEHRRCRRRARPGRTPAPGSTLVYLLGSRYCETERLL